MGTSDELRRRYIAYAQGELNLRGERLWFVAGEAAEAVGLPTPLTRELQWNALQRFYESDPAHRQATFAPPAPKKHKNKKHRRQPPRPNVNSDEFLASFEWRQLRMVVLKKRGARCECCGASPKDGIVIHVDHIKPRRRHPELALTESNLQVLCEVCNHGKGSWDDTDWRAVSQTSGESSADSPVTRSGDGDGKLKSPVVPWPRLNKAR